MNGLELNMNDNVNYTNQTYLDEQQERDLLADDVDIDNIVVPKDPRSYYQIKKKKPVELDLPVPRFKFDNYWIGPIPEKEVTFTNLNDNIDKKFLEDMCSKYGEIIETKIYYHPKTRKHLGLGKILFKQIKSAKECCQALNQTTKMGTIMNVFLDTLGQERNKLFEQLTRDSTTTITTTTTIGINQANQRQHLSPPPPPPPLPPPSLPPPTTHNPLNSPVNNEIPTVSTTTTTSNNNNSSNTLSNDDHLMRRNQSLESRIAELFKIDVAAAASASNETSNENTSSLSPSFAHQPSSSSPPPPTATTSTTNRKLSATVSVSEIPLPPSPTSTPSPSQTSSHYQYHKQQRSNSAYYYPQPPLPPPPPPLPPTLPSTSSSSRTRSDSFSEHKQQQPEQRQLSKQEHIEQTIYLIVNELKDIMRKDINKKIIENITFKTVEDWFLKEETRSKLLKFEIKQQQQHSIDNQPSVVNKSQFSNNKQQQQQVTTPTTPVQPTLPQTSQQSPPKPVQNDNTTTATIHKQDSFDNLSHSTQKLPSFKRNLVNRPVTPPPPVIEHSKQQYNDKHHQQKSSYSRYPNTSSRMSRSRSKSVSKSPERSRSPSIPIKNRQPPPPPTPQSSSHYSNRYSYSSHSAHYYRYQDSRHRTTSERERDRERERERDRDRNRDRDRDRDYRNDRNHPSNSKYTSSSSTYNNNNNNNRYRDRSRSRSRSRNDNNKHRHYSESSSKHGHTNNNNSSSSNSHNRSSHHSSSSNNYYHHPASTIKSYSSAKYQRNNRTRSRSRGRSDSRKRNYRQSSSSRSYSSSSSSSSSSRSSSTSSRSSSYTRSTRSSSSSKTSRSSSRTRSTSTSDRRRSNSISITTSSQIKQQRQQKEHKQVVNPNKPENKSPLANSKLNETQRSNELKLVNEGHVEQSIKQTKSPVLKASDQASDSLSSDTILSEQKLINNKENEKTIEIKTKKVEEKLENKSKKEDIEETKIDLEEIRKETDSSDIKTEEQLEKSVKIEPDNLDSSSTNDTDTTKEICEQQENSNITASITSHSIIKLNEQNLMENNNKKKTTVNKVKPIKNENKQTNNKQRKSGYSIWKPSTTASSETPSIQTTPPPPSTTQQLSPVSTVNTTCNIVKEKQLKFDTEKENNNHTFDTKVYDDQMEVGSYVDIQDTESVVVEEKKPELTQEEIDYRNYVKEQLWEEHCYTALPWLDKAEEIVNTIKKEADLETKSKLNKEKKQKPSKTNTIKAHLEQQQQQQQEYLARELLNILPPPVTTKGKQTIPVKSSSSSALSSLTTPTPTLAVEPPPPEEPKQITFDKRSDNEELNLMKSYLINGIDVEDIQYLKRAFDQLQYDDTPANIEKQRWCEHCPTYIPDPSPPRKKQKKSSSNTIDVESYFKLNLTGSARSQSYYKISSEEKAKYIDNRVYIKSDSSIHTTDNTGMDGQNSVNKSTIMSSPASTASNNDNAREARSLQRRIVGLYGDTQYADAFKFSQLKLRKKPLKFAKSKIHDWGLFALDTIAAEEFVIEYVGEIIRQSIADHREKKYNQQGIGSSYMFRIDHDTIVDATKCGNLSRFINHSCDPNCYAKIITIDSKKKIVIYSRREIKRGEEITYDYKFPLEENKIPCFCGTANCRGTLN